MGYGGSKNWLGRGGGSLGRGRFGRRQRWFKIGVREFGEGVLHKIGCRG